MYEGVLILSGFAVGCLFCFLLARTMLAVARATAARTVDQDEADWWKQGADDNEDL